MSTYLWLCMECGFRRKSQTANRVRCSQCHSDFLQPLGTTTAVEKADKRRDRKESE